MRRDSSGRPNEPDVSGVTKTFASCAGVVIPRLASAARNFGSANANVKSDTSVIVSPSWPSLFGVSCGGVKVPAVRFTTVS